jgi:indole-3-glycerol phosphate synthase
MMVMDGGFLSLQEASNITIAKVKVPILRKDFIPVFLR